MAALRILTITLIVSILGWFAESSSDTNHVFSPCSDATVQQSDCFSFGIAFAARTSFFNNNSLQPPPCDRRLSLSLSLSSANSQLAIFRPKVDEISLLTINTTNFSPDSYGGYMLAFSGRKYAASFLNLRRGRLQNLYWKGDGCASCSGNSNFVCLKNQDCAIRTSNCKNRWGSVDCSLVIQLAFSGTNKHDSVFNSWHEVKNLRQYSVYGL